MKVDFYIIEEASKLRGLHFVCGLVEKYYLAQETMFIHTPSEKDAVELDMLLWTYRDDSFVPHQRYDSAAESIAPVRIGQGELPEGFEGVFINLHPHFSETARLKDRLIEVVFAEPTMQQLARVRYKQYRELGCEITTHKIKTSDL